MAEPTKFSNEYAADMLEDPWQLVDHSDTWLDDVGARELRPAEGKRQYVNKMRPGRHSDQRYLPCFIWVAITSTFNLLSKECNWFSSASHSRC